MDKTGKIRSERRRRPGTRAGIRGARFIVMMISAALALFTAGVIFADTADTEFTGTAGISLHLGDVEDSNAIVSEYSFEREDLQPGLELELLTRSGEKYMVFGAQVVDKKTFDILMDIHAGSGVKNEFSLSSFVHNTDHDLMGNLNYVESGNATGSTASGKRLSNEDTDPAGEYGVTVTEVKNTTEFRLPFRVPTVAKVELRNMARKGTKQTMSINHCSNCHVVSRATPVDEETTDTGFSIDSTINKVRVVYSRMISKFSNHAAAPVNQVDPAEHPVTGAASDFSERVIYEDELREYARIPDTRKTSDDLLLHAILDSRNSAVAKHGSATTRNQDTGNKLKSEHNGFRYCYRNGMKLSVNASYSRLKLDNNDVDIDLPPFRPSSANVDFDWTRQSAFNRDDSDARLGARLQVGRSQYLSFGYRFRSIDRDYVIVKYNTDIKETTKQSFKLGWDGRMMDRRLMGKVVFEHENIDDPFTNATGVYEPEYSATDPLGYYLRLRTGEATNQPSETDRITANFSLKAGARSSLGLTAVISDSSNDNLNTYTWDSDRLGAGVSLFTAPSDRFVFTLGYNHDKLESEAMACVPLMDG